MITHESDLMILIKKKGESVSKKLNIFQIITALLLFFFKKYSVLKVQNCIRINARIE